MTRADKSDNGNVESHSVPTHVPVLLPSRLTPTKARLSVWVKPYFNQISQIQKNTFKSNLCFHPELKTFKDIIPLSKLPRVKPDAGKAPGYIL